MPQGLYRPVTMCRGVQEWKMCGVAWRAVCVYFIPLSMEETSAPHATHAVMLHMCE